MASRFSPIVAGAGKNDGGCETGIFIDHRHTKGAAFLIDVGAGSNATSAARAGEIEADVADLRLRLKESQEREKRLAEQVFLAEERLEDALSTEHELRIQIHRYADFQRALQKSRPWRMIQLLRRLVGREW